ncbi:MAG TPA: RHS repeat-associated core domain-containing protein [Burkholderiaceae bacterium]
MNKSTQAASRTGSLARRLLMVSVSALCSLSAAQAQVYSDSRTIAFSYKPVSAGAQAGLLDSETKEPDPSRTDLCVTTTYVYDNFGNKTTATTANCAGASSGATFATRVNGTSYDSAGQFPIGSTNALSQSEAKSYDPRFGAMTSLTGPNDLTTQWTLDAFGRRVKELRADGTSTVSAYCAIGAGMDTSSNSSVSYGDPIDCPSVGAPGNGEVPADAVTFVHSEEHDTANKKTGPYGRVYIDKLGRQIRTATQSFDGGAQPEAYRGTAIVVDTVYNDHGAKVLQTQPYFLGSRSSTTSGNGDLGVTATTYDALGRPKAIYTADQSGNGSYNFDIASGGNNYGGTRSAAVTTLVYAALSTTTTDDHDYTTLVEKNAIGLVVRVTDAKGAQIAHQHDAFGNLIFTRDALQNIIQLTYDIRGRKRQMIDPDAGTSRYGYDALGQLTSQQNANQLALSTSQNVVQTTMTYDVLGRMTSRSEAMGNASDYVSYWNYDRYIADGPAGSGPSTCSKGVGKLCESYTSAGVNHKMAYDAMGRPLNSLTSVSNGPSFATSVGYDATTGRLSTQTYPTGLQVGYTYTALGMLQSLQLNTAATVNPLPATGGNGDVNTGQAASTLAAGSTLWSAQIVNARGQIELQQYGNNVQTTAGFDPALGRMMSVSAGADGTVLNQQYGWDSLGNLTTRSDGNGDTASGVSTGAINESFNYDALNRLTSYDVVATQIAGFMRSATLQYNALGQILYKSDVGNYSYNAAGGAHPHALQSVSSSSVVTYGYDASGNMLSASGGKYASITYTSFNLPDGQYGVQSASGSPRYTWLYDENHARLKEVRTDASGTRTIWYQHPDNQGGLAFESETEPDGSVTNRHFLSAGGQAIGVLVSTGAPPTPDCAPVGSGALRCIALVKVEYWHKDHLGSLISTTDHTGAVTERYAYDPFGKRRYLNGIYDENGVVVVDWSYTRNWGTARGFTGHEQLDDVGLVNMNGRIFDPALGMFMQVDPMLQDPYNLQNYDRYAYCYNRPLSCTDPSGLLDTVVVTGKRTDAPSTPDLQWTTVYMPPSARQVADAFARGMNHEGTWSISGMRTSASLWSRIVGAIGDMFNTDPGLAATCGLSCTGYAPTPTPNHRGAKMPGLFSLENMLRAAMMGGETQMEQAANADAYKYLTGRITQDQLRANQEARAVGGAIGLAAGAATVVAVEAAIVDVAAEGAADAAANTAEQVVKQRAGDIGRDIIGWGRGQSPEDIAKTISKTGEINPEVVEKMIEKGLTKEWVEGQAAKYSKALEDGGRKLINEQLAPRLELMQKIIQNWTR